MFIIFVNDVNKCYRLKLFLQQFFVSGAVLNAELPLNSRLHIVEVGECVKIYLNFLLILIAFILI